MARLPASTAIPSSVGDIKFIECLLCCKRFGWEDILAGRYWLETLVCGVCYGVMQRQPHVVSCFGKPNTHDGPRLLRGYDPTGVECRDLCPDRHICRRVFV
jgi:hypothetical protein